MPARYILLILFFWQVNAVYSQPAEKILLQTDKQWYYPGETIWFAINVYNACGDTLEQLSNIAYVELTGADENRYAIHKNKWLLRKWFPG